MTAAGQIYTIEDIKGMLLDRREDVALTYAPMATGAYRDGDAYWTLNPGRADRSVGSFVVWLGGPKMGRWNDYASGQHGDLLDLICLSLGCTIVDGLREARSYLGLMAQSPQDVARHKAAAERARQLAAEARRKGAEERERKRRAAVALWLSGAERIADTPVEVYLRDRRCIDLRAMGRQPRALRYHPDLGYTHVDKKTGEITKARYPAMLAIITDARGRPIACHRTWLALAPDGRWDKAPVPKAKKVLGDYGGGAIHLWAGLGPKGGKPAPLSEAPPGQHVYLSEGIEDALSGAILAPEGRYWAAISLGNFAEVALPDCVTDLTLIADRDPHPEQRAVLDRAIATHSAAGRTVRVWMNEDGGKDLNDALRGRIAELRRAGEGAYLDSQTGEDGSDAPCLGQPTTAHIGDHEVEAQ